MAGEKIKAAEDERRTLLAKLVGCRREMQSIAEQSNMALLPIVEVVERAKTMRAQLAEMPATDIATKERDAMERSLKEEQAQAEVKLKDEKAQWQARYNVEEEDAKALEKKVADAVARAELHRRIEEAMLGGSRKRKS